MDSTKKISFGFNKLSKKSNIILNKVLEKKAENNIQLIQCLEENSIKLVNDDENKKDTLLVIPVQKNRTSAALASLKLRQEILSGNLEDGESDKILAIASSENKIGKNLADQSTTSIIEESLEKRAARELLEEISDKNNEELNSTTAVTVPLNPDELPLDGAEESTLDDYEKIPISQFGLAVLRGMGWKEEPKKKISDDQLMLRPKGMGLGADKVLKAKPLLVQPEKNEKLEIKKNAYVRILGGKHKDMYGQIEGLDDHAGRAIVKLALGGTKESFNEFLLQPVSKGEYTKYGKVINSAKYEEYKKIQDQKDKIKYEKNIKEEQEEVDQIKCEMKQEIKKEIKKERRDDRYECNDGSSSRRDTSSRGYKIESKRRESNSSSSEDSSEINHRRSKKKSSKSKKDKDRERERTRSRRRHSDSSEDNRRHKKKTKKRSRSRERR